MQVIHKGEKVNGEVCAKCDNGVPFKSYKKTSGDWNAVTCSKCLRKVKWVAGKWIEK